MNKKSIKDVAVAGKKVVLRVDFNVPIDENGQITDTNRIKAALPTIEYLLKKKAKIILISHLGRPKGERNLKYTLQPVAEALRTFTTAKVTFVEDCVGEKVMQQAQTMAAGEILLLENLRFYAEEESGNIDFARQLALPGELFVNDAFGTAHRAHASMVGISQFLPSVAGLLMEKEVSVMTDLLQNPKRPFVTIIGGAKISDKIEVIMNLLNKVDVLIVGGGMANTFLAAQGFNMQKSLVSEDKYDLALRVIEAAEAKGVKFVLPVDLMVAESFSQDVPRQVVEVDSVPEDWMALDIGPKTIAMCENILQDAQTVIWNGPVGVVEIDAFAEGTKGIAKAVAVSDAMSFIGGGDSVAAIKKIRMEDQIGYISTGGGASLSFLQGSILPGVSVLANKYAMAKKEKKEPLFIANWKMNKTPLEAIALVEELKPLIEDEKAEVVVCPPLVCLESVATFLESSPIKVGAQNMHWETAGAYTGEVSGAMIEEIGCTYVLLGHSERRKYFAETDRQINWKLRAALKRQLTPVLCIGETAEEREAGMTEKRIENQLQNDLADVSGQEAQKIVIAYEPVWAIGTGVHANNEIIEAVIAQIRTCLMTMFDYEIAEKIYILYGGSVNEENVSALLTSLPIDGVLIGGASLKARAFAQIIKNGGK